MACHPSSVETYTFAEAEKLTGLTRKALRNRVYRGKLQAVLRDGVRRIPHSELDRAGLLQARFEIDGAPGEGTSRSGDISREAAIVSEMLERLERQAGELAEMRLLTRQAESLGHDRERLIADLHAERSEAEQLRQRVAELEEAVSSRPWWRRSRA